MKFHDPVPTGQTKFSKSAPPTLPWVFRVTEDFVVEAMSPWRRVWEPVTRFFSMETANEAMKLYRERL